MNRFLLASCLIVTFIGSSFCFSMKNDGSKLLSQRYKDCDSLWIKFAQSLESRNIDYLLDNSLDTIKCSDCGIDRHSKDEYYESKYVFNKYLEKLMHLKSLSDKGYSLYADDSSMNVIYKIKSDKAREGAYDLIFIFVKLNNKYVFKGMILTP